jgi:hypothetical protein
VGRRDPDTSPESSNPILPPLQDFLTKHANKKGSWIGLRDLDVEGKFIWMDGTPVDYR